MRDDVRDNVMQIGEDIVRSDRFVAAYEVSHHGKDGDIATHSIETAGYALMMTRWLRRHGVHASETDVVRACLLHDIGMTERSVSLSPSPVKAYAHPKVGARIAQEEFGADDLLVDAIRRHMWPICVVPPRSIVGWVVTASDKWCSLHELGCLIAAKAAGLASRDVAR